MRYRHTLIAAIAAISLAILPVTTANASTGDMPALAPTATSTFAPLMIKGYDAAVAAENGYKIVMNADGTQSSVPVTPAAIAQQQQVNQMKANALSGRLSAPGTKLGGPTVQLASDLWGDCGGSDISAVKQANDQLAWSTWFVVFGAASGYSWNVSAIGAITTNSWHMSGNGPSTGTKTFEGGGTVIGPGYATVPIWSLVTLTDGAVCYSMGPTAWFS